MLIGKKFYERLPVNYDTQLMECLIKDKLSLYKSVEKYQIPGNMAMGQ